jgi:dolichol-phosphate mannosyltransferase
MESNEGVEGVSVIVPTYNESENIPPLLTQIDDVMSDWIDHYEILVVDDDSPDRTWEVAQSYSGQYPVRVSRRTDESGLATAVVHGIRKAGYDTTVVMDGDLQHPPESIPDLLSAIESGADIAIGSRFTPGGSPGEFSLIRLLTSIVANSLAKALFSDIRELSDIQSGFLAVRKEIVTEQSLDPIGYKILLEILVKCDYRRVHEVGYTFHPRDSGQSNMDIWTILAYLYHLWLLKRYQIQQYVA